MGSSAAACDSDLHFIVADGNKMVFQEQDNDSVRQVQDSLSNFQKPACVIEWLRLKHVDYFTKCHI